jgi:SAM-dependent methyltransferase
MADSFYARRSLNVEIYLARTAGLAVVEGDAEFYLGLAKGAPGPALELGCGPGRLLIPLAAAGVSVSGMDLSRPMLDVAEQQLAGQPASVRERVTLHEGDMTSFHLGERFGLIFIAFRSFMMLTTPEAQSACLARVHEHLVAGGLLAIDLFDPQLDRLPNGPIPVAPRDLGTVPHPETHNRVSVVATDRENDVVRQVFDETWTFTELAADGRVVREEEEILRMRWTYRWEMRYLLELSGFEVLAEYSDYGKSPPDYGREMIFVARKK